MWDRKTLRHEVTMPDPLGSAFLSPLGFETGGGRYFRGINYLQIPDVPRSGWLLEGPEASSVGSCLFFDSSMI